ncbi:MAG: rhomboid family intramembrane serine protease [Catalinimonas sp.]
MNSILDDFKNAFRRPDNGVVQLIIVNLIIFLLINLVRVILIISQAGESFNGVFLRQLALPAPIVAFLFRPWTLITYFFTHEGFWHILWNMLFLYWFGNILKEYLSNRRFVNVYVLGGIAGGLLYLLIYNVVPYFVQNQPALGLIGASGSVYAVVVAAATLIPNYTFNLILIGPVRIIYIATFFLVSSLLFSGGGGIAGANAGGNIAHLGGALMGFLFIQQLNRGRDLGRPLTNFFNWFNGLFNRKPRLRVTHSGKRPATRTAGGRHAGSTSGRPDQAEIDAILDKISHSGYESLSKEEKQKLFSASQRD